MDIGEALVAIFGTIAVFGTLSFAIFVFGVRGIFGRGKHALESEVKELRDLLRSQHIVIGELETRLQNLETIVTSNEYQAAERISRALESSRAVPFNPQEHIQRRPHQRHE